MKHSEFRRFFAVAILGLAIDFFVAWIALSLFAISLFLAAIIGFTVGATFNYVCHEYWTFGKNRTVGLSAKRLALFLGNCFFTLVIRLIILSGLQFAFSGMLPDMFFLVAAAVFSFITNFLISKFMIFQESSKAQPFSASRECIMASLTPTDWIVPAHRVDVLGVKSLDHALVIPVINEGERIRDQLERIAKSNLPVDVIIADGGSTDGSVETDFLKSVNVRALLTKTGRGRLSAQLRMAYAWTLNEGYLGVVTIDGNGKDGVDAVTNFVAKLADGYDYVQGSRYKKGGVAENTPLERTIGNRLVHAPLLSLAGRRWFTDTTNGFRAYSARYLEDPRVAPFRDIFNKYELLFYLTVRAGQLGFKVCEIPVRRSYPNNQAVPTKISGMRGKIELLTQTFKAAFGSYHP